MIRLVFLEADNPCAWELPGVTGQGIECNAPRRDFARLIITGGVNYDNANTRVVLFIGSYSRRAEKAGIQWLQRARIACISTRRPTCRTLCATRALRHGIPCRWIPRTSRGFNEILRPKQQKDPFT